MCMSYTFLTLGKYHRQGSSPLRCCEADISSWCFARLALGLRQVGREGRKESTRRRRSVSRELLVRLGDESGSVSTPGDVYMPARCPVPAMYASGQQETAASMSQLVRRQAVFLKPPRMSSDSSRRGCSPAAHLRHPCLPPSLSHLMPPRAAWHQHRTRFLSHAGPKRQSAKGRGRCIASSSTEILERQHDGVKISARFLTLSVYYFVRWGGVPA